MAVPALRPLTRRRLVVAALLATLVAVGFWTFLRLGTFMAAQQPLVRADAIFVLAGTLVERPLEAADLYHAAYAPRILLTRSRAEGPAFAAARARGARIDGEFDTAYRLLTDLGVPASAIVAPSRLHDNTSQEAETLRAIAVREGWSRVIVVSSKYHLRRAGLACRRALAGTQVQVVMHGTRYDASSPADWWRHRADIRWLMSEVPKLVAYGAGLGG